jgi:coupling of ubiquitin conjugation to ER degradation protein 1
MGEVVNVIVAFAVIVILFRWATTSKWISEDHGGPTELIVFMCVCVANESQGRSAGASLGFRPKPITQDMVRSFLLPLPIHSLSILDRLI